jgi:hypothetical protein
VQTEDQLRANPGLGSAPKSRRLEVELVGTGRFELPIPRTPSDPDGSKSR